VPARSRFATRSGIGVRVFGLRAVPAKAATASAVREWSIAVRILILEDDPFIALDLQMIVDGEGHATTLCTSIADARRRLNDIDFALLDVDVRDGKSFGLGAALRAQGVPFAFVSGSRRGDLPAELRDAPFVAKPFRECEIVACLPGALAARPRPGTAAPAPPRAL
jgi:DNA-binding response OmpR family regulator